jgi:hypothetical protein
VGGQYDDVWGEGRNREGGGVRGQFDNVWGGEAGIERGGVVRGQCDSV